MSLFDSNKRLLCTQQGIVMLKQALVICQLVHQKGNNHLISPPFHPKSLETLLESILGFISLKIHLVNHFKIKFGLRKNYFTLCGKSGDIEILEFRRSGL